MLLPPPVEGENDEAEAQNRNTDQREGRDRDEGHVYGHVLMR
jgi:hypothetical protein